MPLANLTPPTVVGRVVGSRSVENLPISLFRGWRARLSCRTGNVGSIALFLILLLSGCGPNETERYLDRIESWQQRHGVVIFDPDGAFAELKGITPPASMAGPHGEYMEGLRHYLTATNHVETLVYQQTLRLRAQGDDHIPACDVPDPSIVGFSLREACRIERQAFEQLIHFRFKWDDILKANR